VAADVDAAVRTGRPSASAAWVAAAVIIDRAAMMAKMRLTSVTRMPRAVTTAVCDA
jgi:hypothetical protein